MTVRIKVCGIRSFDEAQAAIDAGADALGFVFAKGPHQVNPEVAHKICKDIPPFISRVGVFVNAPKYEVMEIATLCRLDALQFHGDETPDYCRGYSQHVIKAFKVGDETFMTLLHKYPVNAHLLDSFVKGKEGGTGQIFDWELAVKAKEMVRNTILAGGLNPHNVGAAIRSVRPYAVDVSSGVEKDGKKSRQLLQSFVREVREVE